VSARQGDDNASDTTKNLRRKEPCVELLQRCSSMLSSVEWIASLTLMVVAAPRCNVSVRVLNATIDGATTSSSRHRATESEILGWNDHVRSDR